MAIGVWMYGALGSTQDFVLREREMLDAPFGESHATHAEPAPSAPSGPPAPEAKSRKTRRRAAKPSP
jgi:hypothetical protein